MSIHQKLGWFFEHNTFHIRYRDSKKITKNNWLTQGRIENFKYHNIVTVTICRTSMNLKWVKFIRKVPITKLDYVACKGEIQKMCNFFHNIPNHCVADISPYRKRRSVAGRTNVERKKRSTKRNDITLTR